MPIAKTPPRQRKTGVNQNRAAETGEKSDKLSDQSAGFAGVREAKPRTHLPGGILFAVTFPFGNFTRFRINR